MKPNEQRRNESEELRTGIGSNTQVGAQSATSSISDRIVLARSGEQMKWRNFGRSRGVETISRGVRRILGVRYANLQYKVN